MTLVPSERFANDSQRGVTQASAHAQEFELNLCFNKSLNGPAGAFVNRVARVGSADPGRSDRAVASRRARPPAGTKKLSANFTVPNWRQ